MTDQIKYSKHFMSMVAIPCDFLLNAFTPSFTLRLTVCLRTGKVYNRHLTGLENIVKIGFGTQ